MRHNLSAAVAMALATVRIAHADPQSIEEGEPVTVEDAFTDDEGEFSIQYSGEYENVRTSGHLTNTLNSGPTFKLGLIDHVQISLNPTYTVGSGRDVSSGLSTADVLVQFNEQTRLLPAFAVDVFYGTPFGAGEKTAAYTWRALASKSLFTGEDAPRLHVNLTDYHLTTPDADGQRDQLEAVVGLSALLDKPDALVADVVQGAAPDRRGSETIVEIGLSRDLPDDWTAQLGAGRQLAGRGHDVRLFFAIEKQMQLYR